MNDMGFVYSFPTKNTKFKEKLEESTEKSQKFSLEHTKVLFTDLQVRISCTI